MMLQWTEKKQTYRPCCYHCDSLGQRQALTPVFGATVTLMIHSNVRAACRIQQQNAFNARQRLRTLFIARTTKKLP